MANFNQPPSAPQKISSFPLTNTPEQDVDIDGFFGILDIAVQDGDVYLYAIVREDASTNTTFVNPTTTVNITMIRSGHEVPKGRAYLKTIVVEDRAYHFFGSHSLFNQ